MSQTMDRCLLVVVCVTLVHVVAGGKDGDHEHLLTWLRAEGVEFPKIQISWFEPDAAARLMPGEVATPYRGLVATDTILEGEVIFSCPIELLFGMKNSAELLSEVTVTVGGVEGLPQWPDLVAAGLLAEQNNSQSFWSPWISSLPRKIETAAHWPQDKRVAWTEHAPGLLEFADMRNMYQNTSFEATAVTLSANLPHIFHPDEFTRSNWEWAMFAISSRAFNMPNPYEEEPKDVAVNVPLIDMANHEEGGSRIYLTDIELGFFTVVAGRHYNKGEQVFFDYGKRCQAEWLVSYGMMVDPKEAAPSCSLESRSGCTAMSQHKPANESNGSRIEMV